MCEEERAGSPFRFTAAFPQSKDPWRFQGTQSKTHFASKPEWQEEVSSLYLR